MIYYQRIIFFLLTITITNISIAEVDEINELQVQKEKAILEQKTAEAKLATKRTKMKKDLIDEDLAKFGFGLGFGVMNLRQSDIINSTIDNGIIRVTSEEENKMGLWLTTSWINDSFPSDWIGLGPFFGVQLGGNNEIVNSIAIGIDLSFRRLKPKLPLDFQIGYGVT